jgi:hypothetical protein
MLDHGKLYEQPESSISLNAVFSSCSLTPWRAVPIVDEFEIKLKQQLKEIARGVQTTLG